MLTNIAVRNAKPQKKLYRKFDSQGLYLEVTPQGGKYWRYKYRFNNKERRMALGVYPNISLVEAREKRDQARKLLANGIDPSFAKKEHKLQRIIKSANTFEAVAREWHEHKK